MGEVTLAYEPVMCFVCGTDHGKFCTWDGPTVCAACREDLILGGKRIAAIDTAPRRVTVWLSDGTQLEFLRLSDVRSEVLNRHWDRIPLNNN